MSGHHNQLTTNDGLVSSQMLIKSVAEILKRVQLDRDHDIPYLAGYSVDRSRIYIDRHLQKTYQDKQGHHHDRCAACMPVLLPSKTVFRREGSWAHVRDQRRPAGPA